MFYSIFLALTVNVIRICSILLIKTIYLDCDIYLSLKKPKSKYMNLQLFFSFFVRKTSPIKLFRFKLNRDLLKYP